MSVLYDQFGPMVRLAHLMTGSAAVAEDVVQDAFLRVAPHYAAADNPRAYLRAAVVNGCRTHQRHAIRHERASTLAARPEPIYDAPVVEFFDGLRALNDRQRAAVVLRYYLDLGDDEIAELISCAPATVRVLIRRALAHLRKVVNQ
jgi:RNA polymerase sigma factor (sigma-70 family)